MNRNLLIGLVSLVVLLVGVAVVKGGNRERPAVTTEELHFDHRRTRQCQRENRTEVK